MYLLDTNVFIEAHKSFYAMDLVPGYWECLLKFNKQQQLISIDKVQKEILQGKKTRNGLIKWVKQFRQPCSFFVSTEDNNVNDKKIQLMDQLYEQNYYKEEAIDDFADIADGWLVAYAQQHGHTVVTLEAYKPNIKRKVPIPNVCEENNVPCVTPFDMLRSLGVKFETSYK